MCRAKNKSAIETPMQAIKPKKPQGYEVLGLFWFFAGASVGSMPYRIGQP